ncbi:hypothetical protein B0H13DRAFT_1867636 [Mycena leptocephala]|nr:hypothetical protein B0H13DRAFT_1867636 [Mycena leptocephala]
MDWGGKRLGDTRALEGSVGWSPSSHCSEPFGVTDGVAMSTSSSWRIRFGGLSVVVSSDTGVPSQRLRFRVAAATSAPGWICRRKHAHTRTPPSRMTRLEFDFRNCEPSRLSLVALSLSIAQIETLVGGDPGPGPPPRVFYAALHAYCTHKSGAATTRRLRGFKAKPDPDPRPRLKPGTLKRFSPKPRLEPEPDPTSSGGPKLFPTQARLDPPQAGAFKPDPTRTTLHTLAGARIYPLPFDSNAPTVAPSATQARVVCFSYSVEPNPDLAHAISALEIKSAKASFAYFNLFASSSLLENLTILFEIQLRICKGQSALFLDNLAQLQDWSDGVPSVRSWF